MGILNDFFNLLNKVRNYRTQNATDSDVQNFFSTYVNPLINSDEEPDTINPGQLVFVEGQDGGTLYVGGAAAKKKIIAIDNQIFAEELYDDDILVKKTIEGVPVFVGENKKSIYAIKDFVFSYLQTGTNPPTIGVLLNSLGADFVDASYIDEGLFCLNFAGDIFADMSELVFPTQHVVLADDPGFKTGIVVLNGNETSSSYSQIYFYTLNSAGVPTNGILTPLTSDIVNLSFKVISLSL